MTNLEFNSLIKGELVGDALYKKFYDGTSIIIKDTSLGNIVLDNDIECTYDLKFANVDFTDSLEIKIGKFKNI